MRVSAQRRSQRSRYAWPSSRCSKRRPRSRVYRLRDRVGMPGHREREQARLSEQGYLTAGAMASQLGIDISTVRVWASRGKLL